MAPTPSAPTFADDSRIGAQQITTFTLCLLCLIMDGFDVQALGYTAPAIVGEWGVPPAALGPVFAAGNFGVLLGAIGFSMLADRIGRRPVLIGAALFFSVMTLLTARAQSVPELLLLRLVGGIGMGGIIPNATALVGEFSSLRLRATMVMLITVGFTVGAAFGGFIAAAVIPAYGWQAVFVIGGAIPLVIALAMFFMLPESQEFLTQVKGRSGELGAPVLQLFRDGRAGATLLMWVVNFMNLLSLFTLASWLPTVVRNMGYSTPTAVLVGTILQVGGIFGTFGLAWLVARSGFVTTMTVTFAIAVVMIGLIGQPALSLTILFVVVFIAGWCVVGSQPALNALSATYYPTSMRSTGVGAGLGVGRIGAIVGPALGGYFLARQWSTPDLFMAATIPPLISCVAMFSLRWAMKKNAGAQAPALQTAKP